MRTLAAYLMRGRSQAIFVTAISAVLSLLLPPLSYVSGAAIALVTLRKGARDGLLIAIGASLISLSAFMALGNFAAGIAFVLGVGLPVWLLAMVLRSTASLALTLSVAALMGALVVLGVHLFTADATAWWRETLESVKPALEQSGAFNNPQQVSLWLAELARIFTGLLAAAMMLSLVITLLIARWWQAMLYNPGGFRQEFHGLHISRRLALPAFIIVAVALLGNGEINQIATELLIPLLVLYLIQGIALAHRIAARYAAHFVWLIVLYGLLIIALPQMGMVLAAAGFAETWLNFRTPLKTNGDNKPE